MHQTVTLEVARSRSAKRTTPALRRLVLGAVDESLLEHYGQNYSEEWPEAKNIQTDRQLEAELRRQGLWLEQVTGYSPATGHAEPGWAVNLGISDGCDLGRRFVQHAIYHVRGDDLSVILCEQPQQIALVGSFRERVSWSGHANSG